MDKLEKELKKEIELIKFTEKKEENIKSNIYTKYKKYQRNKKILLSVVTCFFIVISSLTIVYADEIKETVDKIIISIEKTKNSKIDKFKMQMEGYVKLNYDAKLNEPKCTYAIDSFKGITEDDKCYSLYEQKELEDILDIKLLNNSSFISNKYILKKVAKKEGNIANIILEKKNLYNQKKYEKDSILVSLEVTLLTKYHEKTADSIFETYIIDGEDKVTEYNVKKLNIKAYARNIGITQSRVWFMHNNIIYRLDVNLSGNKVKDREKEIQEILDSFYY